MLRENHASADAGDCKFPSIFEKTELASSLLSNNGEMGVGLLFAYPHAGLARAKPASIFSEA
jgi:hypothetical protein